MRSKFRTLSRRVQKGVKKQQLRERAKVRLASRRLRALARRLSKDSQARNARIRAAARIARAKLRAMARRIGAEYAKWRMRDNVIDIKTRRAMTKARTERLAKSQAPFKGGKRVDAAQKRTHAVTRSKFRRFVNNLLKKLANHPLRFLLKDPKAWQAGRIAHQKSGSPEIVGVEAAKQNNAKAGRDKQGVSLVSRFVNVRGIPVEVNTAMRWVRDGKLQSSDVGPFVDGWSPK
jgi:hypothetical protein